VLNSVDQPLTMMPLKAFKLKEADFSVREIREQTGVAKSTLYKYMKLRKETHNEKAL
jgi:hypothetical protein